MARVILYDTGYFRTYGLSGELAGLASADAVREVFPVGVFVYAEMLPNGDHERSAPVAYGVERKGERHGAVQFLVQGAQAVACGGRELRKDDLLTLVHHQIFSQNGGSGQ